MNGQAETLTRRSGDLCREGAELLTSQIPTILKPKNLEILAQTKARISPEHNRSPESQIIEGMEKDSCSYFILHASDR